ncbi:MAG: FAD-binding oxidoreductase [Candidatus Velthaea sp.]
MGFTINSMVAFSNYLRKVRSGPLSVRRFQPARQTVFADRASLANRPNWDGRLEFLIRLQANGAFSTYLGERARVGDPLIVRGPLGNFVLDETSPRPALPHRRRMRYGAGALDAAPSR